MPTYKPRNAEVEALQLTPINLGYIILKLQKYFNGSLTVKVQAVGDDGVVISFPSINTPEGYSKDTVIIGNGDYVVFADEDYDFMAPAQFNEMFELVKKTLDPSPNSTGPILDKTTLPYAPNPFVPFTPKPWSTDDIKWNELIVKD